MRDSRIKRYLICETQSGQEYGMGEYMGITAVTQSEFTGLFRRAESSQDQSEELNNSLPPSEPPPDAQSAKPIDDQHEPEAIVSLVNPAVASEAMAAIAASYEEHEPSTDSEPTKISHPRKKRKWAAGVSLLDQIGDRVANPVSTKKGVQPPRLLGRRGGYHPNWFHQAQSPSELGETPPEVKTTEQKRKWMLDRYLNKLEYELVPWNGIDPMPLLDSGEIVRGVLAGQLSEGAIIPPGESPETLYFNDCQKLYDLLLERSKNPIIQRQTNHRWGNYPSIDSGITYSQGDTQVHNVKLPEALLTLAKELSHSVQVIRLLRFTEGDVDLISNFLSPS
ncbi:hypothetical protein NP233_g10698 [Leucocoprinus birnbaumii]|uniref:Uncharacterized protein n=1 Tax=Leucocoprinus birnbaumii TaxID=56174 RepID=A0AAD5VK94_9AGAR|nr:hypothetical protein NP233_g10698 [Leucocoprinus birnbaumii]